MKDRKTGEKKNCRLLSVEGAGRCVLEDSEIKEIYIDAQAELVLPSLPSELIVKPALVWKIAQTKTDSVKVSYLCQGFNWNANYVIEFLEKTLNIDGWAGIENQSGTTFENAKIKLIAGDVNRIQEDDYYNMEDRMFVRESEAAPQAEEKSFFDYHMYTLVNPTTLKDNQTKQIDLLNGSDMSKNCYICNTEMEQKQTSINTGWGQHNGISGHLVEIKTKWYLLISLIKGG